MRQYLHQKQAVGLSRQPHGRFRIVLFPGSKITKKKSYIYIQGVHLGVVKLDNLVTAAIK
jgi:hypothetical protein